MQCPRCNGFILIPTYTIDDDDPKCSACSRSYPHLKPDHYHEINSNGAKPKRGLRETIRYTGAIKSLKTLTCVVIYKAHPSPAIAYPLLEISCPWCKEVTEVRDGYTNPAVTRQSSRSRRYGSRQNFVEEPQPTMRKGSAYIKCPTGHIFSLKITNDGTCSWE